jgi:hypothetical protein
MKNKIDDLRNHLFATLEALQDEGNPMELDRAKAIAEVSQTIINTAKVEVDFLKATGRQTATDFMPAAEAPKSLPDTRKAP